MHCEDVWFAEELANGAGGDAMRKISLGLVTLLMALGYANATLADRLWAGGPELWGKIVAIDNNAVTFQVNCTGEPKKYRWKTNGFAISFTEGCQQVDLDQWGEPVDCRKRGRLFVVGSSQGRGDYVDFVSFEKDVLTFGHQGRKWEVKSPRKDVVEIWLGCN